LKKQFLIYTAIGLVLVAIGIAFLFYIQRGAHIELKGAVLKVRTLPVDASSSIAVLDFRFVNPSNYPFIVRKVDVFMEDKEGTTVGSSPIADVDVKRLFEYYPILGQKYNDSLVIRTRVEPLQSMDRMVAARFEIPVGELDGREVFKIRVEDVDGAVSEIVEDTEKRY
jgi:hypothetical protein